MSDSFVCCWMHLFHQCTQSQCSKWQKDQRDVGAPQCIRQLQRVGFFPTDLQCERMRLKFCQYGCMHVVVMFDRILMSCVLRRHDCKEKKCAVPLFFCQLLLSWKAYHLSLDILHMDSDRSISTEAISWGPTFLFCLGFLLGAIALFFFLLT